MTLPYLSQTKPELTKTQLKKQLKFKLTKYSRGLVPVFRYQILKNAKVFATENDLLLPDWFQSELTKAAKESLSGYVNYLQNPDQFR